MNVLVIGGFLGSGKTTLIIEMAKKVIKSGKKVVVIVNEIGEIGIDTEIVEYSGFDTVDLEGGCICCTLKYDMKNSVKQIYYEFNPDYLFIEPTGIAQVKQTREALAEINIPMTFLPLVTLIDPTRFKTVQSESSQFIEDQIRHAHILTITKCDLATPEEIEYTKTQIEIINPPAIIREISVKDESHFEKLWNLIISEKENYILGNSNSVVLSNVSSCSGEYILNGPIFLKNSEKLLKNIMESASKSLSVYNSNFVGHIKISILSSFGIIKISKTSSKDDPEITHIYDDTNDKFNNVSKLTYLAAVTNIPEKKVSTVLESACNLFLATSNMEYEKNEKTEKRQINELIELIK